MPIKITHLFFILLLSAVTAFAVGKYVTPKEDLAAAHKETAFERVIQTNTLRCGYVQHAPLLVKDTATGKMSGLIADIMDYFSQKTGITVEWSEEFSFGNWTMALQSNRIDAICMTIWPDVALTRVVRFTKPFFFLDMMPIVRADETRFGDNLNVFNQDGIVIGALEGDSGEHFAKRAFPKAKIDTVPPNSDAAIVLQNLVDKKYDMVPWDRNSAYQFSKNNPGKIKILNEMAPFKLIPNGFALQANEPALADMMDGLVEDMLNNGEMERLLTKWEPAPGMFLRVAKPYIPSTMKTY
ncbi:MAG: substrate-binding periplasmic protein [Bdellovibrionales bacterium]